MKYQMSNMYELLKYDQSLDDPAENIGHDYLDKRVAENRTYLNHESSPLLRLPAEIRNMIYEYALGGYDMQAEGPGDFNSGFELCTMDNDGHRSFNVKHLTALTRTCRQIHTDTHLLFYQLNSFGSDHAKTIRQFFDKFTYVQRATITTLVLTHDLIEEIDDDRWSEQMQKDLVGVKKIVVKKNWWARTDTCLKRGIPQEERSHVLRQVLGRTDFEIEWQEQGVTTTWQLGDGTLHLYELDNVSYEPDNGIEFWGGWGRGRPRPRLRGVHTRECADKNAHNCYINSGRLNR